jgi:hypothetical protein
MITIFTIVLDGEPFIERHLPIFNQLMIPWQWLIAEGSAGNTACTKWCKPQRHRLSEDGTAEYLASITDPRVKYVGSMDWPNKCVMVNSLVLQIKEPCVLLEVDADEIHTAENIERIHEIFRTHHSLGAIRMPCRYFVGPDLLCEGENCWSNRHTEWERAWRYRPGTQFFSHEPPRYPYPGVMMTRAMAQEYGLTFDHFAYATEAQAAYKEKFYGYTGLVEQWRRLQEWQDFPVSLDKFFPFAKPSPMVARI